MKKIKIVLFVMLAVILSMSTYGQSNGKSTDEVEIKQVNNLDKKKTVYKTSLTKAPEKVRLALKDYASYEVDQNVTYTKSKESVVYRFKLQKGIFSHYLLVDEKGIVKGIESGEHEG